MFERLQSALQFQDLGPGALADILLLAFVIYQLILLIRGTRSVNMMIALGVLIALHQLTRPEVLELSAVHTVLGMLLSYIPIAVIVLFQSQIRRFLSNLGRNPLSAFMPRKQDEELIVEVSLAAASMASKRLGALIVLERDMGLRTFYETGIRLDAEVSYDLLMNIFTFRSPLHDGAVIIADGRIKAASCYLPLTMNPTLSRTYGTRHRAAFGITEESDCVAVVVSEERGVISLVDGGEVIEHLDAQGLQAALRRALGGETESPRSMERRRAIAAGTTDA
jgi:uncharacterized protein (TIGR00159 family)